MPVKELNLRTDENFYIQYGKERPCVVVSFLTSTWLNELYPEDLAICAPIFTFKRRHKPGFWFKTMGFCYPNLFYLPQDQMGCIEDSVVRFELIQPLNVGSVHAFLRGNPSKPSALSDQAFELFANHLSMFLHGKALTKEVQENIAAYRELVLDALEKPGA